MNAWEVVGYTLYAVIGAGCGVVGILGARDVARRAARRGGDDGRP